MTNARAIAILVALLAAGCGSDGPAVRSVGAAHLDRSDGTTNGRLALAMGQLRLGNVALALEGFRRAAREDPASAEALAGVAECYLRMGRPALAARALEQALALRPGDVGLLGALATAARLDGRLDAAAALDLEIARRAAPPPASAPRAAEAPTTAAPSVTVALAPARPAPVSAPATSVTVALPQPADLGPRLVRMSPGEVMLVSREGSPFMARAVKADATIHAPLRVLNAARIAGIAARTRALLAARGVTEVRIGNAPGRRASSELRFAAADQARAEAVAARLPFPIRRVVRAGPLVLLLGRDAGRAG